MTPTLVLNVVGLTPDLLRRMTVDKWADKNDCSRSEAIRRLVELGLKAKTTKSGNT